MFLLYSPKNISLFLMFLLNTPKSISLFLMFLLNTPKNSSLHIFVFVLKKFFHIVSREEKSGIFSSTCIIQFAFEYHVLLILVLIFIIHIFTVVTHPINPCSYICDS